MLFTWLQSVSQVVETVAYHHKIVDGIFVDQPGNVYTTSGGLVNGTEVGKYDLQLDTYNPNFAVGFSGPIDLTLYRDSLFVVTNFDNNTVYAYHINTGHIDTLATGLDGPAGIAEDTNENIYFTNWGQAPSWAGHQIHKISNTGAVSVYVDSSALYRPQGIAVNHLNEVVVHSQQKLYKINPVDSSLNLWVNVGHQIGNMTFRKKDSCFYGASNQEHKIIKIDVQGNVSIYAGSTQGYQDGALSTALFDSPLGIAFSSSEDTLYIAEGGNVNRLRRIDMNPTVGTPLAKQRDNITISPNPSPGLFLIFLKKSTPIQVEVFDSRGQLVMTKKRNEKTIPIDLNGYPRGNYIIKLSNSEQLLIKQVIKL